ncbi:kinase-like domain-containing protein [Rhizophagus irregularis DAOM 181602=DAOM 197198]|nr:kinase-like domain-containing protein [Rhizophagus irregularis DAOM 181602=DAOM 197198]
MESPNNRLEKDESSSGNEEIDKFIKETIDENNCGFAKVYSATWSDGKIKYAKQDDGKWKKIGSEPMKIALKRIKGSHNMPPEYLNELKIYWSLCSKDTTYLKFYGLTKDPNTKEFMMIMELADQGNLRNKLAYRCMSANPKQRPTANELHTLLYYLYYCIFDIENFPYSEDDFQEKFGHEIEEIKLKFKKADEEIKNISTLYKNNSDAIYTSRAFKFNNLPKPIDSTIILSYLDDDNYRESIEHDSQLNNLDRFVREFRINLRNLRIPVLLFITFKRVRTSQFKHIYRLMLMKPNDKETCRPNIVRSH